jgi:hypothetical protein
VIIDLNEYDLMKAITRTEAKAVHKDLPPGGVWRTIRGHHVYIKDGKVLAGSIPGTTVKAKKATKAHLAEHQAHIDKEAGKSGSKGNAKATDKKQAGKTASKRPGATKKDKGTSTTKAGKSAKPTAKGKGVKADDKKVSKSPTKTPTGTKRGSKSKSADGANATSSAKQGAKKSGSKATSKTQAVKGDSTNATKKPTSKKSTTTKGKGAGASAKTAVPKSKGDGRAVPGAKKPASEGRAKGKSTAKKGDIRSSAQKNRSLAYDVGDKVGGARKDDFEKNFKEKPTLANLDKLEKDNGAVAEKMVTKANLLPKHDFEQEHKNGVDLPTAIMKKLLQDRIAPKPSAKTPEARKAYMASLQKFQRHFEGIKSWDNMKNAIREFSDLARKGERGKASMRSLESYVANPNRYSYFNEEHHMEQAKAGAEAKAMMDFEPLGDKFEGFFTDYKKRESSLNTVAKNMQDGWDKYLNPEAKKPTSKPKDGNKKWERKAEAEHLRTGGKKVSMNKPEELMKNFGVRGVEFGHWVNDSSGKYHLQRSAEAFHDLADTIGIDPKDVSLNGRLAIAFGARGKGTALAHYEPDRKVINMTKYGGAGSLAHEWGHAMDNILYQYSHGGKESMGLASDDLDDMGNNDPKLKALYENVMNAISKPAPGDKGATQKVTLDSEAKPMSRYYPEMRRDASSGMSAEEIYKKWSDKINTDHDRYINNAKNSTLRSPEDKAKQVKKYESARKRELNSLPHYVAKEMKYKNGGYRGEPFKAEIEIPTGNSEYLQRMLETQPGKNQNGSHYWSSGSEMFARVFESWVQHKLDKGKRYNNYLVHGTREGNVKAEGAPFPLGKERQHMFKAMENLMKHVASKNTLKKALILEVLASGRGDMTEELRKSVPGMQTVSLGDLLTSIHSNNLNAQFRQNRSAYNVPNPAEVIYIPINRLKVVYQTDQATNWDKVQENVERMVRGENLEPVVIGFDYDLHDGHHRYEASHLADYTHVPCVVMNTPDEIGRQRAIEAYREVWKSIVTDPVAPDAFEDDKPFMYRGIGQRELLYIMKHKHVMTKGKGNDDDKDRDTCFSNLYSQAVGYAKSNYDLYNEKQAYVIALPKSHVVEDETGELVAKQPVPIEGIRIIPIPKESR